jgi:predicted GNAT family acetyltransferase
MPRQAAGDPAPPVDSRLRRGGMLWLWHDGGPVSTAWTHPPVAGVVRISGVYTPPEHRGRGYPSACVAALSQRLLDGGAVACTLHTDLADPTSNRIYRAIGYRQVAEHGEWRFGTG